MMTPPMYAPQPDGTLQPIPEQDAAVLDRYRDGDEPQGDDLAVVLRYPVMPLVYEPQFSGDPFPLYPLVEERHPDGGYTCYPMPGTVQTTPDGRTVIVVGMGAAPASHGVRAAA